MKVLVVESNIVMTEIISDVLTVDGFSVITATTAQEATVQFSRASPSIIVFDVDTDGANIVNFISSIKAADNIRLIALCSSLNQTPSHPSISASIVKPFKGSEILMAVRKARSDIEAKTGKLKKFSTIFTGLFGKKKVEKVKEDEPARLVPTGKSYLVLENEPNKIYELGRKYHGNSNKLFILTKNTIKSTKNKFMDIDVTIVGITKRAREGYISYSKIGSVMGTLGEFTSDNINCTVIIEGVEEMVDEHGMNAVVTMLCQLVDNGLVNGTTYLVSAKPQTFSDAELKLLTHHLEIYEEGKQ